MDKLMFQRYNELLAAIDNLLVKGDAIVVLEGGSASGKTTLADILQERYDCNVIHMDDFFLRPEQRTPERLSEVGGNIDRERFFDEVLTPLKNNEVVRYRPFDCSKWALGEEIIAPPKRLTVIEGVYSMHPAFGEYYDLSAFLDISPEHQKERILKRNSPSFAARFFDEWIPLENRYFSQTDIKSRVSIVINVK